MQLNFPKTVIRSSACLVIGFLSVTQVSAQTPEVQSLTNFTKNDPTYSDGKLMSCAMQFSTIFTDSSMKGRAFFAEGSVGFVFFNGETMFAPFTKVAVSERLSQAGQISAAPLPVENAMISGDDGLNSEMFESASIPSPVNSHAVLSKYRMTDKAGRRSFVDLATSKSLSISFTIKENGKRYKIPVDLTLTQVLNGREIHSNEAVLGFTNCMLDMTKVAKRNGN